MNDDQLYSLVRSGVKVIGTLAATASIIGISIGDAQGWQQAGEAVIVILGAGATIWSFVRSWKFHA